MKQYILKLGRIKVIVIITIASLLLAMVLDVLIAMMLGHNIEIKEDLVRAGIIPLIIAPFISWYLIGLLFDLHNLEKKMKIFATYDDLTGLFIRRAFIHSCKNMHEFAIRNKQSYCLLAIDIDHFKEINDRCGHACGDHVLAAYGQLAMNTARKSDVLGRMGGEEFAYFLPDTNIDHAREFAEKFRRLIEQQVISYHNEDIRFTVSIGISMNSHDQNLSVEDVLIQADRALYAAKNNGRNRVEKYLP